MWRLFMISLTFVVLAAGACTDSEKGRNKPAEQITCIVVPHAVIPNLPNPAEQHAAGELRSYIAKMTGKTLPVIGEGQPRPSGRALIVGRTESNLMAHNPDAWPRDTIYIGYGKRDIAIIGQGPQGTLFAAYEFLRDQGCRWYMPDNVIDDIIPKYDRLSISNKPKKHTPSFFERGWYPHPGSPGTWKVHYDKWAVRNGLNAMKASTVYDCGPELGHGLGLREGHTLWVLIPSADHEETRKIFAAHPEWYPLVNGQRLTQYKDGRPVQACLSNPGVVREVARKVIKYFDEHPDCWRFSVSPADEPTYWCECDACRAVDGPNSTWKANDIYDAYGVRSKSGPGPMSTRYVKFVNKVAKIVGKEYPDKYISFYAYGSTVAPPREKGWKLEPNVLIEYAFGDGLCLCHGETNPDCPPNAAMHEWLKGWSSSGNSIIFYDYPPNGGKFDIPSGVTRRYKSLIAYTKKMGVIGWAGEGQGSWAGSGMWDYLKARLLWDIDSDVDALITGFCRDLYGPAARPMQAFYNLFESELQKLPDHPVWGAWAFSLKQETVGKLSDLLAEAENKADTRQFSRNVAMMRVALNSLELVRLAEQMKKQSTPDLAGRYSKLRTKTYALTEQYRVPVTDRWRDQLAR